MAKTLKGSGGRSNFAEGMATAWPVRPGKQRTPLDRTPQRMKDGTTQGKIRTLFTRYVANLGLYRPELPGQFLCPLCLHGFPVECIEWGHLSLAHVVPDVLGGRLCTLLCKACNNTLGAGIEAHADRRRKLFESITGNRTDGIGLKLSLGQGSKDPVELQGFCKGDVKSRIFHIEFKDVRNSPRAFEESIEMMKESCATSTPLQLGIPNSLSYRDGIANLIYYSIAYHALFFLMGYEFVFSSLGLALREVVCLPDEYGNIPVICMELSEADYSRFEPGDVVLVDDSLGVVMPEILPAPPRRVLLLGSLLDPIGIPWDGTDSVRKGKILSLPLLKDEQHLAVLRSERSIYHGALYGKESPMLSASFMRQETPG